MELRIKSILKGKKMTLNCLSEKTGISASNLSNYCSGNISPTLNTLCKIAAALDVDVADLLQERKGISIFVEYKDKRYDITENDIINLLTQKSAHEHR